MTPIVQFVALLLIAIVIATGLWSLGYGIERLVSWLIDRILAWRRPRVPELLPPPIDGRTHNAESIAEYQRKRALIDRSEVTGETTR